MPDRPEAVKAAQPETESNSLFGRVFSEIKHGAGVVRDTTISVVKQGVQKGEELVKHPTTNKIVEHATTAGKEVLHQGQEIAQNPTTKKIVGQVSTAGQEVAREHVDRVHGVIDAGKRGDVNGVIRNGAPLAGEVMLGPAAAAGIIAKEKGSQILLQNVPPEHRETVRKLKQGTDLLTTKPTIPNLIIEGQTSGKY